MKVRKIHIEDHYITIALASSCLLCIVAYMYFLSQSVVHVVMRNEAVQSITALRSEIAYLEASYIEAHHTISARVASTEGFSEISAKIFINESPTANLVLRTQNE